jgi:hypothetical protein
MAATLTTPIGELAALAVERAMLDLESLTLAQHARRIDDMLARVQKIKEDAILAASPLVGGTR